MEAVEFIKTVKRLCKNRSCNVCPVTKEGRCMAGFDDKSVESIEETISKVEQWAKDHPVKTRQSEFLKKFPKAIVSDGAIALCPQFYCVTLLWRTVFSIKKVCCHIPLTLLPTTATELMALFMTMFSFYLVMSTESTVTTSRTTTVMCGLPHLGVSVTRIPTRATLTTFASCTLRGS